MRRYVYAIRTLSTGAVTLGFLQAFEGIDFASMWANFLTTLFTLLVTWFLGGSATQFAAARGLANPADLNCHFVMCNGAGGGDGEIQATEKWQQQWSIQPSRTWQGSERTIRICLVGDRRSALPTDYQLKRLEILLEALCRKFRIPADSVYLPRDCE